MSKVIAVSNQKGGVGKTSVTLNLGTGLARNGYKVLMIDNDYQAND
ncbi:MAG: ParA family protein [Firmicutes bacterium]|nr:ParA family protein [Bacillota bacterium]